MIKHNIMPLYNKFSEILILGSFPSVKSREQQFFYGNPQNRFWKVLAKVFKWPSIPETIEEKKNALLGSGIALWDVIKECNIKGSDDSSITDVIPNDLSVILNNTNVKLIFCNGNKAYSLYNKYLKPIYNKEAILLPSTSPANAAMSVDVLTSKWDEIISSQVLLKRFFTIGNYQEINDAHEIYRPSVRAIIKKDDEHFMMVHSLLYDYYKYPGGGIDKGENHLETLIRETKEEAGLQVIKETVKPYGSCLRIDYHDDTKEYFIQENYYYTCKVLDEVTNQNLDDYENKEHFTLEIVTPDKVIETNFKDDHGPKSKAMIKREAIIMKLLKGDLQ